MANEYCQLAKAQKMEYTLLFCEIGGEKEAAKESRPGYIALGYDVAWTMGDFYSAVWHEILNMPGNHPDRKLNENGLFDTWKQANDFLESKTIIEGGTFSVVRIYKVV